MSLFDTLPTSLFHLIVRCLTLDDQCAHLPMLSKPINQSINRSINRSINQSPLPVDYVSIDVPDSRRIQSSPILSIVSRKRAGRLPYLQHARLIDLKIAKGTDLREKRRKNIVLSIRKSLITGRLECLSIGEVAYQPQHSIFSELLSDFGHSRARLRELYVDVSDSVMSRPLSYWGSLKQCKSLRYVRISMSDTICEVNNFTKDDEITFSTLLSSFPDSVEDFSVKISSFSSVNNGQLLAKFLRNQSWLPFLRRFLIFKKVGLPELSASNLVPQLAQTIMHQTNKVRPIDHWFCLELAHLNEAKLFPVTSLSCGKISSQAAQQLNNADPSLWPNLTRIALMCADFDVSVMPLLKFASQRPIEQFSFLTPSDQPKESWSNDMVKLLSSLQQLEQLYLEARFIPMFQSHDLSNHLPANSWSNLMSIELTLLNLTEQQLVAILAAAPNARLLNLSIKSTQLSSVLMLAIALHYCPSLVILGIGLVGTVDTFETANDAFIRYPTTAHSGQNLVRLSMFDLTGDVRMFHYVCRRLECARNLAVVNMPESSKSPFHLCLMRALPRLRVLRQIMSNADTLDKLVTDIGSSELNQQIEFVVKPSVYGLHENRRKFAEATELVRAGETFDDIVNAAYANTLVYPLFSCSIDERGRDGRKRFYDILYETLSREQQTRLTNWDAEDQAIMSD